MAIKSLYGSGGESIAMPNDFA